LVSESFRRDIGQLHSPRAEEALQIGGLFHQGQFPYCRGYESGRVQTIFQINLEIFILLKILIMKNLTDFLKSVETGVDPCLRYYRNYTITLPFCFEKQKTIACGK